MPSVAEAGGKAVRQKRELTAKMTEGEKALLILGSFWRENNNKARNRNRARLIDDLIDGLPPLPLLPHK